MKPLKIIDTAIQVIMLVFFLIKAFFIMKASADSWDAVYACLPAYFIVGGYQFASCMIQHHYQSGRYAAGARGVYQKMLIWVVIIGIVSIPCFLLFLGLLLIVSPFMAVFYTWLSVAETIKLVRTGTAQNEFFHE